MGSTPDPVLPRSIIAGGGGGTGLLGVGAPVIGRLVTKLGPGMCGINAAKSAYGISKSGQEKPRVLGEVFSF